jgi:hypothetical protein
MYSEMLLLFFVPQILNFLYSCPQVSKHLHPSQISSAFVNSAATAAVEDVLHFAILASITSTAIVAVGIRLRFLGAHVLDSDLRLYSIFG